MKRLLKYLKPHKLAMLLATVLVLLIIVVELYRPIIIGDAIDDYINGYYKPFTQTDPADPNAVKLKDLCLARVTGDFSEEELLSAEPKYYQLLLFEDKYYMTAGLTAQETQALTDAEPELVKEYIDSHGLYPEALEKSDLKELRRLDFKGILRAAALYLAVLLAGFALNWANTWTLQKMGQKIIYTMREEVFSHIQSLSLNYFNTEPVGKLVTRVSNDTEAVNELFTTILVRLFQNVVMIGGYAVIMLAKSPGMTAVSFIFLPFIGVLTFYFRHVARVAYQITRNKITEINIFLSEHLSGMRLIQIFARERDKFKEFERKTTELFNANFRETMIYAIFRPSIYMVSILARITVIAAGSWFVLNGKLSLGTLFVFISYISSFFEPIQELAEQFGTLQSSLASAEKVFSVLDVKPDIVNVPEPKKPPMNGEIEFKNVWFAYEKDDYILKDVSFKISPGEKVAFVGATGAGKTSILNLIGRYFDIQKGEILIDGVNIKEIDTDVLRGAIGQVQQDVFLFTGDVKSNISLGSEKIGIDDVKRAAETVRADEFIKKMPDGYDTAVTERGSTLSAGQRQLISFARTLAYKPSILVLDEATANIDTETEGLITHALERLMEGRTTIMVAHRLSTIQHADKIIVMHHGRIHESGTHQELLKQNGLYKKLYDLQLVDK